MMPKKNILFLIADDLGKYVGCYGCRSVSTPNIDKLSSEGVTFDYAFASTASCSGSRSTLYTGLHTHENGQYGLNIYRTHFQTFPHVRTLPGIFNDAGYLTGIIGKVHVGPDSVYPWQHRQESDSRDVAWVSDQVEAFLEESIRTDKSFYLTVGFVDPHRDITTRGGFGNDNQYDRIPSLEVTSEGIEVPTWLTDLPATRAELVEYYKAIHRLDIGIGRILEALKRQCLDDDTLVVFTSDNGPPFINAKTTLYDAGTCLPLIVRAPGCTPGLRNPNMISFIDVFPTFLDFAGINCIENPHSPPPPKRIGRSFFPVLNQGTILGPDLWQQHVFGSHTFHELQNYWPTRVVRTRRFKYHRNVAWRLEFPFATDLYASLSFEEMRNSSDEPMIGGRKLEAYLFRPAEELFDLENDPNELNNLANDEDYRAELESLRSLLESWQSQTRDLWLYRDSSSVEVLQRYRAAGLTLPNRFDMIPRPITQEKMIPLDHEFGN